MAGVRPLKKTSLTRKRHKIPLKLSRWIGYSTSAAEHRPLFLFRAFINVSATLDKLRIVLLFVSPRRKRSRVTRTCGMVEKVLSRATIAIKMEITSLQKYLETKPRWSVIVLSLSLSLSLSLCSYIFTILRLKYVVEFHFEYFFDLRISRAAARYVKFLR